MLFLPRQTCWLCGIGFLLLFSACAPSRFVKPLEKKQHAASFSFGGPLINYSGAPIPIPFTTLAYGYGLTNQVTVYGGLHTTSLLFGNLQSDLGASIGLLNKSRFGLSVSPALQLACNLRNKTGFRAWPSVDFNATLHLNQKPSYLYGGVSSWFELASRKAHLETQQRHAIPNLHLGYSLVKSKWQHQFELKYLAAGIPNLPNVVDYVGVSGRGSLGIYYSLIRKF
jgi:hypothetical protein